MKVRKWLCIGTITAFSPNLFAVPPESANQYQNIPKRNVFALKEIPITVPQANTEPPPALPKIFLTGITTLGGYKRALFAVQYPAKAGQPAKEEYLMLAEGQREEGIEVLKVDENAREVRVNNSGTEMSLNFEKNGVKTTTTAANAAPNQPNQPGLATPGTAYAVPSGNPSTAAITPPQTGFRRTLRLPNPAPPPPPTTPVSPPPSSAALGVPAAAAQQQATGTATPITAEEELLLRALQEKSGGQVAPQ
jgi:hypothetical protein